MGLENRNKLMILLSLFVGFYSNLIFAKDVNVKASQKTSEIQENKNYSQGDKKAKSRPTVLDFEEDVIEGERISPSLFVQMDVQTPKIETVNFLRKDFNDFHKIQKLRKPRYRSK